MSIIADVMKIDIPLFLGLDLLSESQLLLDFENNVIKFKGDGWTALLIRENGHIYIH